VALGLTVLVSALGSWPAFADLTDWTYDFLVNHGSYARFRRMLCLWTSTMPRSPRSTSFLFPLDCSRSDRACREGRSAVIGLDILLSEPRNPDEDAAMQRALTSAEMWSSPHSGAGQIPYVMPLPTFCQPEKPELPTGFCAEGKPGALATHREHAD